MKENLAQCVEPAADGSVRLTVKLPDSSAIDRLAEVLARMVDGMPPKN